MKRRVSTTSAAIAAALTTLAGCTGIVDEIGPGTSDGALGTAGAGGSGSAGGKGGTGGSGSTGSGGAGGSAGGSTGGTGGTGGGTAGGVGGGGSAGSGGSGGAEVIPPTFETFKQVITQASCSDASCHNGEVEPRMVADDPNLYTNITTHISECENLPVVNPGKPQESALVKLINGPCGELPQMPNGCVSTPGPEYTCLPQNYIDALTQWVANGAPQQ